MRSLLHLVTLAALLMLAVHQCVAFQFHTNTRSSSLVGNQRTSRLWDIPAPPPPSEPPIPEGVKVFDVSVPLGDGYKPFDIKLRPLFANSQIFVTTYKIPFDLNAEPQALELASGKVIKMPTVTKDGKGGEKINDILRCTTCWVQGMQGNGAGSDIMNFAGMVKWQKSLFDCTGAPWSQIVDALVSNTPDRGETVTLVFEREVAE